MDGMKPKDPFGTSIGETPESEAADKPDESPKPPSTEAPKPPPPTPPFEEDVVEDPESLLRQKAVARRLLYGTRRRRKRGRSRVVEERRPALFAQEAVETGRTEEPEAPLPSAAQEMAPPKALPTVDEIARRIGGIDEDIGKLRKRRDEIEFRAPIGKTAPEVIDQIERRMARQRARIDRRISRLELSKENQIFELLENSLKQTSMRSQSIPFALECFNFLQRRGELDQPKIDKFEKIAQKISEGRKWYQKFADFFFKTERRRNYEQLKQAIQKQRRAVREPS